MTAYAPRTPRPDWRVFAYLAVIAGTLVSALWVGMRPVLEALVGLS